MWTIENTVKQVLICVFFLKDKKMSTQTNEYDFLNDVTLAVFGKTFRKFGPQCSSTSYFIWPLKLFWIRASVLSLL